MNASSESSIAMPPPFENMTRSIVRPSRMKHVRLVDIAELFDVSKREVTGWAKRWLIAKPWP